MKFVSRYLFPFNLRLWKGEGGGGLGGCVLVQLAFNMTVLLRRPIFETPL